MSSEAYQNPGHADHKTTVEKANTLAKQLFGETPAREGDAGGEKPLYASVPRPPLSAEVDGIWPVETEAVLRKEGHAAGLTDKQVEHFLGVLAKGVTTTHGRREAETKAGFQALRTKWGEKFDTRLAFAKEAVRQFSPGVIEKLERTGLGNDPDLAEVFYALGESMREQGLIVANVDGIQNDKDARAELRRLMQSAPYFDAGHKNHAAVVEAANKLSQKICWEG